MSVDHSERLARERAFHDERFASSGREAQEKYYRAIDDGAEAFNRRLSQYAAGMDVVEMGCATGLTLPDGVEPSSALGIDISAEAVRRAEDDAKRRGLRARFYCGDAHELPLADASVDLVFGRGILHHLELERGLAECARVLRPGGRMLFWEPLGHNPLINAYRAVTPRARTEDEHPLMRRDLAAVERYFQATRYELYGLWTLGAVLTPPTVRGVTRRCLRLADKITFSIPGVRWMAWYALIDGMKPAH